MDEQGFLRLLQESPYDPELLLAYADWLEENGRDDEALAARLQRVVRGRVAVFTREQAEVAGGGDLRVARKWFRKYPGLRVLLVGRPPVSELGLVMMPLGRPGGRRGAKPADDDLASPVLYHRHTSGYGGTQAAFVRVPF